MTIGRKRFEAALEESLATKQDSPECVSAELGAYVAGVQTIRVADEPDKIWCRIGGNESDRVKAFNNSATGVGEHWDLPIIICRDPLYPDMWRVAGRDLARYETWGANYGPALTSHGLDHSFSGAANTGADPVWVYKRQFMPLLPRPTISGSMSIFLDQDFYYFNGSYEWWGGTGTADLTQYKPTGTYTARFVTIYIDGNNSLQYLSGLEFNASFSPKNPGPYIPVPDTDQGVPIAAVYLTTGTTAIPWRSIYDLRYPHSALPGTGSFLSIYDDGQDQGTTANLNFARGINAAISGAFGDISLDQGFAPTWTAPHRWEQTGSFAGNVYVEGDQAIGGNLDVSGSVTAGAGSFYTPGDVQGSGTFIVGQQIDLLEQSSIPANPPSGYGRLYADTGIPYFKDSAGAITNLATPGAAAIGGQFHFDDVPIATGTSIDWGDNLSATVSGSTVRVNAAGGGAGDGNQIGVYNHDEGEPMGTGTVIDWAGRNVSLSGTVLNAILPMDISAHKIAGTGTVGTQYYYGSPTHLTAPTSHSSFTSNQMYAVPIIAPRTRSIHKLQFQTGFASVTGAYAQIGFYDDDGNNYPRNLISPTFEQFTPTDTTYTIDTGGAPTLLGGRLYWVVFAENNGAVQIKRLNGSQFGMMLLGSTAIGSNAGWAWSVASGGLTPGGSLPSPYPAGATQILSHQEAPIVMWQYLD